VQGRGFDGLPDDVTSAFNGALVRSLEIDELRRALRVATGCLLNEIRHSDPALVIDLEGPLTELGG
jgi:hypothetical protein